MSFLEPVLWFGALVAAAASLPLWWCALVGSISETWVVRERGAGGRRAQNPIVAILWTYVRWWRGALRLAAVLSIIAVVSYSLLVVLLLVVSPDEPSTSPSSSLIAPPLGDPRREGGNG